MKLLFTFKVDNTIMIINFFNTHLRTHLEGKEERESEKNINCLPTICTPKEGPNLQLMCVPLPKIEPATFQFTR